MTTVCVMMHLVIRTHTCVHIAEHTVVMDFFLQSKVAQMAIFYRGILSTSCTLKCQKDVNSRSC